MLFLFIFCAFGLSAQNTSLRNNSNFDIYKDNAWEVGLHAGHFFAAGNVDFVPGYAGGLHVRRAMDYVFSWRFDMLYGSARGEDAGNTRNFDNTWMSGSLQGLMSMNNLKWSLEERKTNVYLLLGVGLNGFSVNYEKQGESPGKVDNEVATHADIGAGISFRINERFNLGLEHKGVIVLGKRSDLPDGFTTETLNEDNRGNFRDVLQYTSFRVNYNFGKNNAQVEPLYWLNPLDAVLADVSNLQAFNEELADEDNDGVFDKYDQEKGTLAGVTVNSKGETLDSDLDGVPDYLDQEPFSPPGFEIDSYGVAQQPDLLLEAEEMMDTKVQNLEQRLPKPTVQMLNDEAVISLSLPTIYFSVNSSRLGGKDIVALRPVAELMRKYSSIRLVVIGHSDVAGKESRDRKLSYRRTKNVIDHLVNTHGISRSRLVLQYEGSDEAVVNRVNEANRRVAFKIATFETDMD